MWKSLPDPVGGCSILLEPPRYFFVWKIGRQCRPPGAHIHDQVVLQLSSVASIADQFLSHPCRPGPVAGETRGVLPIIGVTRDHLRAHPQDVKPLPGEAATERQSLAAAWPNEGSKRLSRTNRLDWGLVCQVRATPRLHEEGEGRT